MPHDFSLSTNVLSNGRTACYARLNNSLEPKFLVGYKTLYEGTNTGLYNTAITAGQEIYNPADYTGGFGFWAYFIYPTAMAESKGSYHCLNTYDRAKFTFTFMQFAAHVPNGDFVIFLKKLLALPAAANYFPKLVLQNGRIFYRNATGTMHQLENDSSTQPLMDYFNPTLNEVETQEKICAARMVHWAMHDPDHRRLQVETAIEHMKKNMIEYSRRFDLNNFPAKICQAICDIRHQGRAKNDRIANALNTGGDFEKAYANLCTIGAVNYQSRIDTTSRTIRKLDTTGLFSKKYDSTVNGFVDV
jgi:hypothetical protein